MSEEVLLVKVNELNKIIEKVGKNRKKIEKFLNNERKVKKLPVEVLNEINKTQKLIAKYKEELAQNKNKKSSIKYQDKTNKIYLSKREREVEGIITVMNKALEKQNYILKLIKTKKLV